ncbi:MAG: hypothetical protein MI975_22970, partial [Cytophagales bacterium]|nr:hypothetical protein [Cytophagales bacterium]
MIRNAQLKFFVLVLFVVLIIYLSWGLIFFDENLKSNQSAWCETKREEFFTGKVSDVYLSWKTDTLN